MRVCGSRYVRLENILPTHFTDNTSRGVHVGRRCGLETMHVVSHTPHLPVVAMAAAQEVGLDIAFDVLRSPRNAGPDAPVIQTGADTVRRLMRALQAEERHVDALDVFLAYDEVMVCVYLICRRAWRLTLMA
jgi:hypothetical protein